MVLLLSYLLLLYIAMLCLVSPSTGLSPKTGLPFSPPIAFRAASRKTVGAREKATLEEGLCHACSRWVIVEGVKAVDVLVPEIYWCVVNGSTIVPSSLKLSIYLIVTGGNTPRRATSPVCSTAKATFTSKTRSSSGSSNGNAIIPPLPGVTRPVAAAPMEVVSASRKTSRWTLI
jgi:hypothetical protein